MSLKDIKIDWDDKKFVNAIKKATAETAKDGAEYVAELAKRNLERKAPGSTGTLASQIEVKASKFEDGGWIVEAQGKNNYDTIITGKGTLLHRWYAIFVELGTSKMEAIPYLRPALRRGKYYMRKFLAKRIEVEKVGD